MFILPSVWSTDGPVLEDGVPPRSLFQSNAPLLVSVQPHSPGIDITKAFSQMANGIIQIY